MRDMIGCMECDLLISDPSLSLNEVALCPRCGNVLTTYHEDYKQRAFSLAVAGLVFLIISFSFPFLTLDSNGIENSMTLFQTVTLLSSYGAHSIALIVFLIVILLPVVMLLMTLAVAGSLLTRRFPDPLVAITRWLYQLNTWSMVDVFAIAVVVSLVKMITMAHIEFGIAFWSYLAFAATFLLAITNLDRRTVWAEIELQRSAA